ncbi:TetR/AcrR family transcriptional regulator [Pseudonocardia alaniniphila]|uniref:TetR/AcrR family transcriptional regulator n=1 Tax=Pseudonocardia alaniniphila TaxID=75291 RepID=A0ABS9TD80_9PSEU|nr:TetR/AcrR family transcriptional regulator [Pseudonocardia alaniniphila]MCH6166496.1 TetR/AcrR family transcriptional regulator [Pseudonocardia alaniniphila]
MNPKESGGLRERKKVATREALSAAALRLALERGPENVRVEDIAEAAGVSPRTYNNYFASREQAIVAAIEAERALRIGAALRARPAGEPLAKAVVEAVVEQYVADGEPGEDMLALITSAPRVRAEFLALVAGIEQPLTSAIAARTNGGDDLAPAVLGAAVSAAARVAAERWLRPSREMQEQGSAQLLVVPLGSLADILREALAPLVPALQAADPRGRTSNPEG